jgi:hypothetical protein
MAKTDTTDPREALRNCQVHIRQINEAIDAAHVQRSDAVAAGDLDLVRKLNKRIADLQSDLSTLEEGRKLFEARAAKLDSEDRIAACDAATEELKPAMEQVCAAIERLEDLLIAAGAGYAEVLKVYGEYEQARVARAGALPKVPHWRAKFDLGVFRAYLNEALADSGKYGLEKIDWR